MKVFISWSGDLSRELGEAFRDWLPGVLQSVKPFFTPNDIEKGARWNKDIAKELEDSSVGIFCLTKENLSKPWMMFEAGALSKKIDSSKVCPILFGVDSSDLEGPLVQFQAAPFEEVEIRKLIKTINGSLGDGKLEDSVLNSVFEMWWPRLNEKINKILEKHNQGSDESSLRSDREILEEILELSRINASSRSRVVRGRISPGAFEHLLSVVEQTVQSIINGEDSGEMLKAISPIIEPLDYMMSKNDLPRSEREEFRERARELMERIEHEISSEE